MSFFERLAEERIREAMERGEFDDLPRAGEPLPPDSSRFVPEELRLVITCVLAVGQAPPDTALAIA